MSEQARAVDEQSLDSFCDARPLAGEMLALMDLDPSEREIVAQSVPGGAGNLQDAYPLTPLQEGMLFHHLLNGWQDTYVLSTCFELQSAAQASALIEGLQKVVDRHDVLRTTFLWERLSRPLQVIHRQVRLHALPLVIDAIRDPQEQIIERMQPRSCGMDPRRAPLIELYVTPDDVNGRWYALLRIHHLICDYQSLRTIEEEAIHCIAGRAHALPTPTPTAYRRFVCRSLALARPEESEAFFRSRLADVAEATSPFDLMDVHGDGSTIAQVQQVMDLSIARRVREQARSRKVSTLRLFHAAWALVVAKTTGREDVVFGTVLQTAERRGAARERMLGMAVNTLPLRVSLNETTAQGLIESVSRDLTALLDYQQTPLALAQRCSGLPEGTPLFTTLLNCRRSFPDPGSNAFTGVRVLARGEASTNYPIALTLDDTGDEFLMTAQTDQRLDPRRLIAYLEAATKSLMTALEQAPETPAMALSVLSDAERHQVVELFNATRAPYPAQKLIHELFEEQVERTPHEVAVLCAEKFLTYRQLNHRANQLGRWLRQQGAGPDRFVGLYVERGVDMVVGMLGILKAGAAYVPLDASYPQQRLEYILQDAAPNVVVTQAHLRDRLPSGVCAIAVDTQWGDVAQNATTNVGRTHGANSSNLAYVIYTSGSTGQPKGVAIEHRNAVNLIWWAQSAQPPEAFEQSLHSTSLNFDLSVYECFVPLSVGGTLTVVENVLALLEKPSAVTLINTVPSAINAVLSSGSIPRTTRVVNLAGEVLKKELVERIFASSEVRTVCNLYGPSETTTYSTWIEMPREAGFKTSIGRPIDNTHIYVLDRYRQPVPLGVVGEIYIGGAGVARGYLNRDELTAQRFLADPFSFDPGARMYATGDLGRWRADGTVEYLGRNDHQVKIRGFRIELGEIEAQLTRHPKVREAVVVAREDEPGERRLAAYIVLSSSDAASGLVVEELRRHLEAMLPEHMVPSAFMVLEQIPLTSNGKLDRRALPAPAYDVLASVEYEAPQGEIEETVAQIWRDVLRVERVGRHDNFFKLGGHSLVATRAISRVRELLGVELPLRAIFDEPVMAQAARRIQAEINSDAGGEGTDGGRRSRQLHQEISEMHDEAVLMRIAELEKQFGCSKG